MSDIASLLMPTVLPGVPVQGAPSANVAVAGEGSFANTLAQLQAMLFAQADPAAVLADGQTATAATATTQQSSATPSAPDIAALIEALNAAASSKTPGSKTARSKANEETEATQAASQEAIAQAVAGTAAQTAQTPAAPIAQQTQSESAANSAPASSNPQDSAAARLGLRPSFAGEQPQDNVKPQQAAAQDATQTETATVAVGTLAHIPPKPTQAAKRATPPVTSAAKSAPNAAAGELQASAKRAEAPAPAPQHAPASQRATATSPQQATTEGNTNAAQPTQAPAAATPVFSTLVEAQQIGSPVAAQPQAGVPLEALAVHIARKFEAGQNQFEIRLHPAELGQLDISLSVSDDGHVQAVLRAERPETLDMLQRDARSLEQQLRQAGLDVGSNSLSFSLSNGQGQRHAPFSGWPGFAEAQDPGSAAKEEVAAKYVAVRISDGVDIRV